MQPDNSVLALQRTVADLERRLALLESVIKVAGKDVSMTVFGSLVLTVGHNLAVTCGGTRSDTVAGTYSLNVGAGHTFRTGGAATYNYGSQYSATVNGNANTTVTGQKNEQAFGDVLLRSRNLLLNAQQAIVTNQVVQVHST